MSRLWVGIAGMKSYVSAVVQAIIQMAVNIITCEREVLHGVLEEVIEDDIDVAANEERC